jgi:hypothetical protein
MGTNRIPRASELLVKGKDPKQDPGQDGFFEYNTENWGHVK